MFGASGISGWSTLLELLKYPTLGTFTSVTGLTNRLITFEEAFLPDDRDAQLHLASSLDLSSNPESVIEALATVPFIQEVTHVFYFGTV